MSRFIHSSFLHKVLFHSCVSNFSRSATCYQTMKRYTKQITVYNYDDSHQSPIVVLFGWSNGKLNHLKKYSELFEERSFTSVCVTTSFLNSIFRPGTAGRKESQNVQHVLDELLKRNPNRKLFLYSFSNGGCSIYSLLTDQYCPAYLPGKNIKGVIFDSCPVVPNEESAKIVQRAVTKNQNPFVSQLISPVINVMVMLLLKLNRDVQSFMEKMEKSQVNAPHLFLFSKTDELAPYKDILDFMKKRKQLGVDVNFKLWNDSPHVGHLMKHKEEYVRTLNMFIDKCLCLKAL